MIWTSFDSFTIIHALYYIIYMDFPIEIVLNSLQTQNELVFRPQVLQNFFMKIFLL